VLVAVLALGLVAMPWGCSVGKPPGPPRVGDSLTLRGPHGERVQVRLRRVIDPLTGGRDPVSPGLRRIGIELTLHNVGHVTLKQAPADGAEISTTGVEEPQLALVTSGVCGGSFAGAVVLDPEARQAGCIPFEVGRSARLRSFSFRLAPSPAARPGRWRLGG
jgi:hypothetical protein